MAYILGITGPGFNNGAALLRDGKLIAAAEEERFSRIKHRGKFSYPKEAIDFCLQYAGITFDEVEKVAVGWDSASNHYKYWAMESLKHPPYTYRLPSIIKKARSVSQDSFFKQHKKKVVFYRHHLAHAASAYFVSGFKDANIITMDGYGETDATVLHHGKNQNRIDIQKVYNSNDSIGELYARFTDFLGFRLHSEEGKVMGLASYGDPVFPMEDIIQIKDGGYKVKQWNKIKEFLSSLTKKKEENSYLGLYLIKKFNMAKRKKEEPLTKKHQNIAATIQNIQEQVLIHLAEAMYERTAVKKFCLAGGSNLNCVANGLLLDQNFCEDIFIQPASNDAGTAIGAAFLEHAKEKSSKFVMEHPYWGPEFTHEEIKKVLIETKSKFTEYSDICGTAAELLSKGKIVGWFQGRMEIGPRALGNRSILGNPTELKYKDIMNIKVKHREPWRPFAPSLLSEVAKDYLENSYPSPYMILSTRVKQEKWGEIPAVTHVDGTTRPHTVERKNNPKYYDLIKEFGKITGTPVVLNTSFNDKGEPIVCTPTDAIRTFKNTGMDYLAIGNFLVSK